MENYDELIKALRCEIDCNDCSYWQDVEWNRCDEWRMRCDATDAIEELISILPKWISVKDGLPPSNELVIVSIYETLWDTAFRYSSIGWLTSYTKVWVVEGEENSGVTHWMKLPEMKKGK